VPLLRETLSFCGLFSLVRETEQLHVDFSPALLTSREIIQNIFKHLAAVRMLTRGPPLNRFELRYKRPAVKTKTSIESCWFSTFHSLFLFFISQCMALPTVNETPFWCVCVFSLTNTHKYAHADTQQVEREREREA